MCRPEWRRARVQAQRLEDLGRLRRVRDRIDREYAQPLNVEALARDVHISAGHLSRQFRAAYGESPYAYLMTRRIERATALLRRGDLSVTEVCFAVGCASLGTFTTRFTELVGMPPGTFRRRAAAGGSAYAPGAAVKVEGMPACVAKQFARDGKVVCHFHSAEKFKSRYATLGFSDRAALDDGAMWPTAFALKELTAADEQLVSALVKKACA